MLDNNQFLDHIVEDFEDAFDQNKQQKLKVCSELLNSYIDKIVRSENKNKTKALKLLSKILDSRLLDTLQ